MQHRGEIVESAIRKSGYSISKLAQRVGKSRRWMYLMFDNPNVPIDHILKIGYLINHDFSNEIQSLRSVGKPPIASEPVGEYHTEEKNADYWKQKYFDLLEEYYQLTKNKKEES